MYISLLCLACIVIIAVTYRQFNNEEINDDYDDEHYNKMNG